MAIPGDSRAAHVVHQNIHFQGLISLKFIIEAFHKVFLKLAGPQVQCAHGYPKLAFLGELVQCQIEIHRVLQNLDLARAHLKARRLPLLDQVVEEEGLGSAKLLHLRLI